MAVDATNSPLVRRESGADDLASLAEAMLALRSTHDLGLACGIAAACAVETLRAHDQRLLKVDPRSGALRVLDESGNESPYLPEPDGPVEWAIRHETAVFDEGRANVSRREALLWMETPTALATIPLLSGGVVRGVLLLAFDHPRPFQVHEQRWIRTFADGLALALERTELRQQVCYERERAHDLEKRLHNDEETSSHLMSVVAHEIRSPLTAIKAYAEALLDSLSNSRAPRDRFLGIINDECDRLARLVGDILDISRFEAGKRPLRLSRFGLGKLVEDTLETLTPVARSRQVTFTVDVEPGLVLEADHDLLKRLLLNLVGNAVKYSPMAGNVLVHAGSRGEDWECFVQDQGPGIAPEDLPHVFERFFRARALEDQQVDGHGLGLAIARGIVEMHGGRIWARSRDPVGTRLCFAIPLRQRATLRARRIARQIASRADVQELFEETLELAAAVTDALVVSLMLVDSEEGDLFIAASRGPDGHNVLGRRASVRSGVAGSVAAWGKPLRVDNIETDRRFARVNHPQYATKSLLCVPLRVEGEVLGVVNVTHKSSGAPFDDSDLESLSELLDRVGGALERAWAHPGSQRVVEEALADLRSMARRARDASMKGEDLPRLANRLARSLDLREPDAALIEDVARLRDAMSGDPTLAAEVQNSVAAGVRPALGPGVGVEVMRPPGYLARVKELMLTRDERWDGSGYPHGLKGEEIPLGSRVLAVVETYGHMTRGQGTYRMPRGREEAIRELRRQSEVQFDPRVVETFVALVSSEDARR